MKKTQEEKVLEYLKKHRTITPYQALDLFGCFRLASIIFRIKEDGHEVITQLIMKVDADGETMKYAKYNYIGGAK